MRYVIFKECILTSVVVWLGKPDRLDYSTCSFIEECGGLVLVLVFVA